MGGKCVEESFRNIISFRPHTTHSRGTYVCPSYKSMQSLDHEASSKKGKRYNLMGGYLPFLFFVFFFVVIVSASTTIVVGQIFPAQKTIPPQWWWSFLCPGRTQKARKPTLWGQQLPISVLAAQWRPLPLVHLLQVLPRFPP